LDQAGVMVGFLLVYFMRHFAATMSRQKRKKNEDTSSAKYEICTNPFDCSELCLGSTGIPLQLLLKSRTMSNTFFWSYLFVRSSTAELLFVSLLMYVL
jgi:hypothetical protein